MQVAEIAVLLILLAIWGAQFKLRLFLSARIKLVLTTAVLAAAVPLAVNSYILYNIWLNSPLPIRYFLPPHTSINYYFFTIGRRFWLAYIIALAIALLFFLLMQSIRKDRKERIFESEEPYIITLAITLVGHPSWIFYLFLSLATYLIVSLLSKGKRSSLYYFWIPIAMLTLIVEPLLSKVELLRLLQLSS